MTRQRTQARQFRDLCRAALLNGVNSIAKGGGSSSSRTDKGGANIKTAGHVDQSSGWTGVTSATEHSPQATRRSNGVASQEEMDSSSMEMLEKGGVDGGGGGGGAVVVLPGKEHLPDLMHTTLKTIVTETTYCDWADVQQGQSSSDSNSGSSTSRSTL